jgi:hypothetical protein
MFVVVDDSVDTLREAVLNFAEQCGVDRVHLQGLRQVSGHLYGNYDQVVIFNIDTRNVSYSTPYALCKAAPSLKVGDRYFRLSEISNVKAF